MNLLGMNQTQQTLLFSNEATIILIETFHKKGSFNTAGSINTTVFKEIPPLVYFEMACRIVFILVVVPHECNPPPHPFCSYHLRIATFLRLKKKGLRLKPQGYNSSVVKTKKQINKKNYPTFSLAILIHRLTKILSLVKYFCFFTFLCFCKSDFTPRFGPPYNLEMHWPCWIVVWFKWRHLGMTGWLFDGDTVTPDQLKVQVKKVYGIMYSLKVEGGQFIHFSLA